jgi:hypothetical protein
MTRLILLLIFVLLAGCATTNLPPLSADNPASPDASESVTAPARAVLGPDEPTKRTQQLLAARAQQDSSSQQQIQTKETTPGMNMPGM